MPAHKPASSVVQPGILETIKKKPTWLIPLFVMPLIIVGMLTVILAVPSPKTTQTSSESAPTSPTATQTTMTLQKNPDAVVYENQQYGFRLYFPPEWKDVVKTEATPEGVKVSYTPNSETTLELFTVVALPEEYWRTDPEKPYLLSSRKGIVYGYTTPDTGQPLSNDILNAQYQQFVRSVPQAAQTFSFIN